MVKKILISLAALAVVLVAVVALQPSTFRIERSVTIAAPAEQAFSQVNDFRAWARWSPYEKVDPAMKRTFSGSTTGSGAVYAWSGTDQVGEGRMTIEESRKPALIRIKLEFIKPFAATNTATFTFTNSTTGTEVTWAMDGNHNFIGKAASLVMDMDKMVGGDFERGLAELKKLAEHNKALAAAAK